MSDQTRLAAHSAWNVSSGTGTGQPQSLETERCQRRDQEESRPFLSDTWKCSPEELGHGVQGLKTPLVPRPPVRPKPCQQNKLQHLHSAERRAAARRLRSRSSEESSSEPVDTDSSCGSLYGADLSASPMQCFQGRSGVAPQTPLPSSSSSSSLQECDTSESAGSTAEYHNGPVHTEPQARSDHPDIETVSSANRKLPPVAPTKPLPPMVINLDSPVLRTSNRIDQDYMDYMRVTQTVSSQHSNLLSLSQGAEDNRSSISMSSSSSILFPVRSEDLRKRSYLEGSLLASGALLGASELDRYFPDRKVRVFITTWNMQGQQVFWFGDFNFRLDVKRAVIDELLQNRNMDSLRSILHYDELTKKLQEGSIFKGFKEAEISFLPTYKFDIGCDVYDSSAKQRTPSYTDRIIYKSRQKGDIFVLKYGSCTSIKTSDHRPVYGYFQVRLRPGRDNIPLCAGQFYRDIYKEGIKRRFVREQKRRAFWNQKNSVTCSVS
ncbi:hypothetical protein chiPu_0019543 [Chiloscyllium punctatum]|uniref:Inositol polyphosphate-related phosphatase domain-containing protein n=1 Tax=Chiloscyllium punctatum TaxID=137246 RepID=A0A401RSH0_CHIPU|nr:hypothetical protein [Chiloscyllium punctatum]